MTTKRRNVALVIEGMGSSAASSAGIAWHYGKATIGTPGNYEWLGGTGSREGLIRPPDSVGCSVDRFECQLQGNAHTFELHASGLAKALFLGRPTRPRDVLSTAIDEDDTTVAFNGDFYAWSSADDGTVVWIGDEAIKLGTYGAGPQFTSCTRGFWSTTACGQPAGMNVYAQNPKIINRRAQLMVYDRDAGTTTQAWQGFVQSLAIDNGVISVSCQDVWSRIVGAKVNRGGRPFYGDTTAAFVTERRQIGGGLNRKSWHRTRSTQKRAAPDDPIWLNFQVGEALVHGSASGTAAVTFTDNGTDRSQPQLGSDPGEDFAALDNVRTPIYEVFAVDRVRDESGGYTTTAAIRSATRYLSKPYHPVSVSMALLTSSWGRFAVDEAIAASIEVTSTIAETYTAPVPTIPSFIDYAWEVDDLTGYSDGDTLTGWPNAKGGVDMTVTSAPKWYAGSGSPYVQLSGGYLNAAIGSKTQPNTVIVVWNNSSTGSVRVLTDSPSGARNSLWLETDGTLKWAAYAGESAPYSKTASPALATGLQMSACVFNGSSTIIRVNGTTSSAMTSTGTNAMNGFRFGANVSGLYPPLAADKFYAVYVVDGSLSTTQLNDMQTYCQSKWGTP